MILRDYQAQLEAAIGSSLRAGHRKTLAQAPTGSGKTAILSSIVHKFIEVGKRVIVLVPRRELAYQVQGTLERFGRYAGIIMAGEERLAGMDAYVCSFDTLHARCMARDIHPLPTADVVIVDEAHLALSQTRTDIINAYPQAHIVGFTATPARSDGRGLGEMFDNLVLGPSIAELTEAGHLVPMRYFAGSRPDLKGIKMHAGDYQEKELDERADTPKLVGDIVDNWLRLASDRQTVVFCTSVKHSRHVCEMFQAAGVQAEHLDGNTPKAERASILERVRRGITRVVTNVYVCSYGLDIPELSCAVMARPTKSPVLWYQTVGRVLRPAPEKTDALLLDHAGCVEEHGFIDEPVEWSLEGSVVERREEQRKERKEPKAIECRKCGTVFKATHVCPGCGHELAGGAAAVPFHEADLHEIGRDRKRLNKAIPPPVKRDFYAELLGYAQIKGYSPGWAAHKYRERFGVWPNAHKGADPQEPTKVTKAYITHLNIKRAKSLAT